MEENFDDVIRIRKTFPQSLENIFQHYSTQTSVLVDLSKIEFIKPYAITGLFIFLAQLKDDGCRVQIEPPSHRHRFNYLTRIGFFDKVEQNDLAYMNFAHSHVSSYDRSGILQELFWLSQRNQIQRIFNRCGKILLTQGFQDDVVGWVTYIVGELCDNVFNHATMGGRSLQGAFTCVQSYPQKNQVQISVGDFGKGIRRTLNESSKYNFSNDQAAIIEALKPGVSGHETIRERRGNGLTDILTIARKSGSNFDIRSGCGKIFVRGGHVRHSQHNGMLEGTLIGFDLSTDNIGGVPPNLNELRSETNNVLDRI